MCGFAGFAASDPQRPVEGALARRMASRLAHRGPDGEGLISVPGCAMAHQRLAIIDLSERGAQPMSNEDGAIWIVFNGEIYNHVELRRELETRHPFHSESDTEVILHLYEDQGPACVKRLRGMFAFALWDSLNGRLLLARDRLGKKPLHYRIGPEGIAFASEIPSLLASGEARAFDSSTLGAYLCLGYIPAPATGLEGILRLPAGCTLTYEKGRADLKPYWAVPIPPPSTPLGVPEPAEVAREVLPLLEESVRIRLRSDVPVGVFLSGGLDSSIVAALAARHVAGRLKTFTVVFPEAGWDESATARETAEAIGSDHHEIRVEARAAEALPALIRLAGEPLADSSLVAVHRLSEAVRGEVKVALSGDGGDEVFLGYDRYRAHRLAETWRLVPGPARRVASAAVGVLPGARERRNFLGRASRFLAAAGEDAFVRNDRWICRFAPERLREIVTREAAGKIPRDPLAPVHRLYREARKTSPLDAVARADLALWLADDVLRKVDIGSMACALEVRSPLLDQEVVEAVASIPAAVRMPRARSKEVLKACARGLVPPAVLSGRKAGFSLPVDLWLRGGPLRDLAHDVILSRAARSRGVIRPQAAERLLGEHESGAANHDEAIWTLMVLEIFLEEVVDSAP